MRENIKSILLVGLIVVSLVQSYYLIYRMPGADSVANSEASYVQTEDIGPRTSIENTIFPDQMILHLKNNKHTVFYPASSNYNAIYSRLKGSNFSQFRRLSVQTVNWNEVRNDAGLEMTFSSGIPVSLLERTLDISPDSLFEGDTVNRIWIYNTANSTKPRAFFFSASGDVVYEATDLDWTSADIQQMTLMNTSATNYLYQMNGYYIPQTALEIQSLTLKLEMYTTEQMQRNLFFDPGATRNINEENGTEIYTDSKRSLQVDTKQKWMTYTDPTAPTTGTNNVSDNVLSAIDFVNQHGGWPGSYMLMMDNNSSNDKEFIFRQYIQSYPIVDTEKLKFGYMKLVMEHGTVSSYERSMLYTGINNPPLNESNISRAKVISLPGGKALQNMIKAQIPADQTIRDIYPAYRPTLGNGVVVLNPVWMVKLQDGQSIVLTSSHTSISMKK